MTYVATTCSHRGKMQVSVFLRRSMVQSLRAPWAVPNMGVKTNVVRREGGKVRRTAGRLPRETYANLKISRRLLNSAIGRCPLERYNLNLSVFTAQLFTAPEVLVVKLNVKLFLLCSLIIHLSWELKIFSSTFRSNRKVGRKTEPSLSRCSNS